MHAFNKYLFGFIVSIALTLAAYFAVVDHAPQAIALIFGLAVIQVFVQLIFFLHLGTGRDSRWNWVFVSFAALVVFILVGGSLWIMNNLNYSMTPDQMNASMLDQAE